MGTSGVPCAFRQICRILLEKDTKESLEYIAEISPAQEKSPWLAAVTETGRTIYRGEGEDSCVLHIRALCLFVLQTC